MFQFTHPGKGATERSPCISFGRLRFQFTHPGKGATGVKCAPRLDAEVSIHAPWEGCDGICSPSWIFSVEFQFTHPGKGATSARTPESMHVACFNSRTLGRVRPPSLAGGRSNRCVSIHAPWEGCDELPLLHYRAYRWVSIHAPWEGCDSPRRLHRLLVCCFNSRTLGRVRRKLQDLIAYYYKFQFTHPGKGATMRR